MAEGHPGGEGRRRAGKNRPAEGRRRAEPHRRSEPRRRSEPPRPADPPRGDEDHRGSGEARSGEGHRSGEGRPAAEGHRAHRQAEAGAESAPRAQVVSLGIGVVLTAVAWFYLVRAAVDFGVAAVNGLVAAWLFTLGAALGAVVCLVLMLALVGRGLRSLGFISDYKPRRAGARRRH